MTHSNRVALVTGAGRGIGRSIALSLAKDGLEVIATARSENELQSLTVEIEELGGKSSYVVADMSDDKSIERLVEKSLSRGVDTLVNNAGLGSSQSPNPIVEFDDDFWELTMKVNVTTPYQLTKKLLPGMLENGFGRIINISSINAKVPAYHGAAYTASKHAIAGLTKATALEVAGSGVTANAICPGVTATEMNDKRIQYDAKRLGKTLEDVEQNATPMGRRLNPDEISPLASFLASEHSQAINGQLINVCGGTVLA